MFSPQQIEAGARVLAADAFLHDGEVPDVARAEHVVAEILEAVFAAGPVEYALSDGQRGPLAPTGPVVAVQTDDALEALKQLARADGLTLLRRPVFPTRDTWVSVPLDQGAPVAQGTTIELPQNRPVTVGGATVTAIESKRDEVHLLHTGGDIYGRWCKVGDTIDLPNDVYVITSVAGPCPPTSESTEQRVLAVIRPVDALGC